MEEPQVELWMNVDESDRSRKLGSYPQSVQASFRAVFHKLSFDGLNQDVQVIVEAAIFGTQFDNGPAGM